MLDPKRCMDMKQLTDAASHSKAVVLDLQPPERPILNCNYCEMFMQIGVRFFAELTELIARKVGVKPGRIVLGKFANQETQVQLTDNVRGQDVYVIQVGLHPLL